MALDQAESATAERRSSALSRLLARFRRAHGADPSAPARAAALARVAPPPLAPALAAAPEPPLDPVTLRQWLWGPGCAIPGDTEHVLGLVRPFGLTSAMTMLDLSAGLGGPLRTVADAFNTYTVGLERDPDLAQRGMAMSLAQRLGKRAPVSVYDPESFDLPPGHYDCVLGREATYTVRDKERFLRVVMQGLKAQSALILTEFVRDGAAGDRPERAGFAPLPGRKPLLWTLERYEDCLKSLGFELRIAEDISAAYRRMILAGWSGLAARADLARLPRSHFAPILDEAERSLRTIRALDGGALKMVRLHALARRSSLG